MIIVLQGVPVTRNSDHIQQCGFNRLVDDMLVGVRVTAPITVRDITDEGVFLTAAQVREIVTYGMADGEASRLLVEFNKKQPQEK